MVKDKFMISDPETQNTTHCPIRVATTLILLSNKLNS